MTSFTSILFPGEHETATEDRTAPDCFSDLRLDHVVTAVTAGYAEDGVEEFFYTLPHDIATVSYRQDVFRDLSDEQSCGPIRDFIADMGVVLQRLQLAGHVYHPLQRQGWFVDAAVTYCNAVTALHGKLAQTGISSTGLRSFASHIAGYLASDTFTALSAAAWEVQDTLHAVRYVVHIQDLRVHVGKFDGQADYSPQVTATFQRFATEASKDYHLHLPDFPDMNHVEEHILEFVAKLYPEEFALLASFCTRNVDFVESAIARFDREIRFYLSYLDFMHRFAEVGRSFSYPEMTVEPGVASADNAIDLALAVKALHEKQPLVGNDFRLSGSERIFVVTGPNQGGKTTFARSIGQCAYLAALGCPVPADRAAFTLPDRVYTHFERQETLTTLHGKLDDELIRIHEILSHATATSVLVMNESFASTTVSDALLIGGEVLSRITDLGCVAVYVSFVDELASFAPSCVSMVGGVDSEDPSRRTFEFVRRPADGLAYAAALANKYGLDHTTVQRRISRKASR